RRMRNRDEWDRHRGTTEEAMRSRLGYDRTDSLPILAMRLTDTLLKRSTQSLLKEIFCTQLAEPYQIAHTVQKHHDNHFHPVHSQNETSPSTQVKCTLPDIPVLTRCRSMNPTDTLFQKPASHEHQTCRSGNLPHVPGHRP